MDIGDDAMNELLCYGSRQAKIPYRKNAKERLALWTTRADGF